ncbi:UNVERIFIED_CONTAM: hypothetical protein FKN15_007907 [Acipenser sinensis]
MDVSVSVSLFQDELASTVELAVKAALDSVVCAITEAVGSKFTLFQVEMSGLKRENESLKLRLEISESELKAVRRCINAADADIKQPFIFQEQSQTKPVKMDVSVSVSLFQDELASTVELAVKAALDSVVCAITEAVGSKFTLFQVEMSGLKRENETLKLRLEISESELKAVRGCINAADADIKQPFIFQDELASTVELAVKAALDSVVCAITEAVGSKFTLFQVEMSGLKRENETLKLRLEISESELKAVRGCINAADAHIKQPFIFQDPIESHAIPESEAQEGPKIEAVYTQEESFEQEWCASLLQVTELPCVKDEDVPEQECVPIKEEFIEQKCVSIAEERPTENNICTLEENNKLGSNLCDDSPSECDLGFGASKVDGEHDSTPSPLCKNSSRGKPQCKNTEKRHPKKSM